MQDPDYYLIGGLSLSKISFVASGCSSWSAFRTGEHLMSSISHGFSEHDLVAHFGRKSCASRGANVTARPSNLEVRRN